MLSRASLLALAKSIYYSSNSALSWKKTIPFDIDQLCGSGLINAPTRGTLNKFLYEEASTRGQTP